MSAARRTRSRTPRQRRQRHQRNESPVESTEDAVEGERSARDPYTVGLAFTGGGIRSASFSSGVLAEFIEKRLYRSPLDHDGDDTGNQRGEISQEAATSRQAVAERLSNENVLPRVDKVLMSAVSGGGYTAAAFVSWLKRLQQIEESRTRDEPDRPAMQNLLYTTREFIRHMHIHVGYSMADYRNCVCSWRFVYAVFEYLLFFGSFALLLGLTFILYVPIFVVHTEYVVAMFGVDLLTDSPPPGRAQHRSLGMGPIWTWIYLVCATLGMAGINSVIRRITNPRKQPTEKVTVLGFIGDFSSIFTMLFTTVPAILTANFVNAIIMSLSLTEHARFRVHLAEKVMLGLMLLLLVTLPSSNRVQRNFLGLLLVCAVAGSVLVPLRLCDPELLHVARVENPPGSRCDPGVPLIPRVLFLQYSKEWWGLLLNWSVLIFVGFMSLFRNIHRSFMGKFYQWRLKRAFFNRGNASPDDLGRSSLLKSLHWNLNGSCPPRWSKLVKPLCRRITGIPEEDSEIRDPPLGCASQSVEIVPAGDANARTISFQYITSFTFNLWKRIKLFYVPRQNASDRIMGAIKLYGPFDDPQSPNQVYYKSYEQNSGLLVADHDGYHPIDSRFPEYYRIRQRTCTTEYVYHTFREALGWQPHPPRPQYSDGLLCSEAMGISGAVIAPDMGDHALNRMGRTILTMTGISLGQEVSFFPLKVVATLISLPVFALILNPFLCRGLQFIGSPEALSWYDSLPCETHGNLFSQDQSVAFSASILYILLALLVAFTSRALNSTNVVPDNGPMTRLWRILMQTLSQVMIVSALRNVLGLDSLSRGSALTYRQMYEERRADDAEMQEQPEVPAQLHLSDGGHTDLIGALPLFCRRCDEIYIAYGGGGADGEGMDEQVMATLKQAEETLGCSFYVPGDSVSNRNGEDVPLSDIRNALHHRWTRTFPEDAHPFFPELIPGGRNSLRPWSFKFKVVYPRRPEEINDGRGFKEGIVYLLQSRYQPVARNQMYHIDMERAVDTLNYQGEERWRRDAEHGEYNEIHEGLYGVCCQCWSTNRLARSCCEKTKNLGFLGRFPNHFTFNQCFYPRMYRAYHYHGRQAFLEALGLGLDPLDDPFSGSPKSKRSRSKTSGRRASTRRRRKPYSNS
eukprot:gb/GECG01005993.1/.p1 GENE.gb/GECG01005993.1/~~gb/GECG01005993.1/.p1  ORF type:complete len:1136 (+),score=73.88 gb/GECG01005993.1/:1-3408(+)